MNFLIIILYLFKLKNYLYYKKFNFINIAMALNNNYTYPTMVSITSALINKKNNTFINFHLIFHIMNYLLCEAKKFINR